jgi:hypothetical protein
MKEGKKFETFSSRTCSDLEVWLLLPLRLLQPALLLPPIQPVSMLPV